MIYEIENKIIDNAVQAFLENTLDHSESKCCEH